MARDPAATDFTLPVGRLVQGDVDELNEKDATGKPRLVKNGPNAGKPSPQCFFAVAIPKVPGQHWAASDWGSKIWAAGHAGQAQAGQMPAFAWKIVDGDATTLNQAVPPRRWCDYEGFPGHWIVRFTSSYRPKLYTLMGVSTPQEIVAKPSGIECGYYVEVNCTVAPNRDNTKPGVYINPNMVCLRAYGERIVSGPDVSQAGFGQAPLPAGAMATPPAGFNPAPTPGASGGPAASVPCAPSAPTPGTPAPPGTAGYSTTPPPPAAPNPAFLQAPGFPAPGVPGSVPPPPGAAPSAPPPPVAGPQMTPLAGGVTYAAYVGAGWTDAQLREKGLML